MQIQILGPGCKRCEQLFENTLEATKSLDSSDQMEVNKVKDLDTFAKYGVFVTPALVIEDEVVSVGKVLTKDEIVEEIKKRM